MSSRPQPTTSAQEPASFNLGASQHVLEPRAGDNSGSSSVDGRVAVGASHIALALQPPDRLANRPPVGAQLNPNLRIGHSKLAKVRRPRSYPLVHGGFPRLGDWNLDRDRGSGSNSSRPRPPSISFRRLRAAFLMASPPRDLTRLFARGARDPLPERAGGPSHADPPACGSCSPGIAARIADHSSLARPVPIGSTRVCSGPQNLSIVTTKDPLRISL